MANVEILWYRHRGWGWAFFYRDAEREAKRLGPGKGPPLGCLVIAVVMFLLSVCMMIVGPQKEGGISPFVVFLASTGILFGVLESMRKHKR